MCRSILEGGRRCPCDSNESRRLRRHNQQAVTKFRDQVAKKVVKEAEPAVPTPPVLNIETLKQQQAVLQQLQAAFPHEPRQDTGDITITYADGTTETIIPNTDQVVKTSERLTREFGQNIIRLAEERVDGDDSSTISDDLATAGAELEAELKLQQKVKEAFDKVTMEKYNGLVVHSLEEMRRWPEEECTLENIEAVKSRRFHEHLKEIPTEDLREILIARNKLTQKVMAVADQYREAREQAMSEAQNRAKKHNAAALAVLREIRQLGGATIESHESTVPAARKVLAQVQGFYPPEWVEESNEGTAFVAKITKGRAHYTDGAWQQKYVVKPRTSIRVYEDTDEPPQDSRYYSWERLPHDPSVDASFEVRYLSTSMETTGSYPEDRYPDPSLIPKPRGNKWQLYHDTRNGDYIWRRPVMRRELTEQRLAPELTISGATPERRLEVGLHEFAHRVEGRPTATGRRLSSLQEAFVVRRTTDKDGVRQAPVKINPRDRKEIARPDDFAHAYIGRDYGDVRYHEVLSVGAESMFGTTGKFGGLLGADGSKPDQDMRAFILGLWGSA